MTKPRLLFRSTITFFILIVIIFSSFRDNSLIPNLEKETYKPNSAFEYEYEVSNFVIDEKTLWGWEWAVNTFDWCSGSGEWDDPYLIENVSFYAEGGGHGLAIWYSRDDYFEVRNCKAESERVLSTPVISSGIRIMYSSNGTITNTNMSNNYNGISIYHSYNMSVVNNYLSNNRRNGINFVSSDNNTLSNNTGIGNGFGIILEYSHYNTIFDNTESSNSYGISLKSSVNNTVSENNLSNNRAYGLYLSFSHNNTVLNNFASDNLYNGIEIRHSQDNLINNNTILKNMIGLSLGWDSDFNTFINNSILNNEVGINIYDSMYNSIIQNRIYNNNMDGILIYDSIYNSIIQNNVSFNGGDGIDLSDSKRNIVMGNQITFNQGTGIYLEETSLCTIFENFLSNNTFGCFRYERFTSNDIYNNSGSCDNPSNLPFTYSFESGPILINDYATTNTENSGNWLWAVNTFPWISGRGTLRDPFLIQDVLFNGGIEYGLEIQNSHEYYFEIRNCGGNSSLSSLKAGIGLNYASKGKIFFNYLTNNTFGISIRYSDHIEVRGNYAWDNFIGIYLYQSHNISILGNNASFNDYSGISIRYSDQNLITGNNASYNDYGIRMIESEDNTIWLNSFCENAIFQAYDDKGSNNEWDNSTIGNYFGDYTDKYPEATSSEGIWSIPYQILGDTDSIDNFPLVIPPVFEFPSESNNANNVISGYYIFWILGVLSASYISISYCVKKKTIFH